jgi:hypothetical protein
MHSKQGEAYQCHKESGFDLSLSRQLACESLLKHCSFSVTENSAYLWNNDLLSHVGTRMLQDVTQMVQSNHLRPSDMSHTFEGNPAKHTETHLPSFPHRCLRKLSQETGVSLGRLVRVRGKILLVGGLKGCYWWKRVWHTRELHTRELHCYIQTENI